MANITMCNDDKCPVREICYRFKATPGVMQSYFMKSPLKARGDGFDCDMFWEMKEYVKVKPDEFWGV